MGLPPAVLNRLLVAQPDNDTGESTPISEDFEFEFEIDGGASPKQVLVDPVVDDPHRFRLRMVSDPPDESPESPSPRPIGVTEMLRTRSEGSESRRVVAGSNVTASYVLTGESVLERFI